MSDIKLIDVATAKAWLDEGIAIFVDVREPGEYAIAHIPGATLMPIGTLNMNTLPQVKNKKIIIHCQFGKRGSQACEKLLQMNPTLEIYNLAGGLAAWQQAGFYVEE